MESPWDETAADDSHRRELEFDNIATNFTNVSKAQNPLVEAGDIILIA